MHKGITGLIRKTKLGRGLLFHINTGLFWIYGLLTFWLVFTLSGFWLHSGGVRFLVSLLLALVAAFTLAKAVHFLFWNRFHNVWMDNYFILGLLLAILAAGYFRDVHDGRNDALPRLRTIVISCLVGFLSSYLMNRKREASSSPK